MKHHPAIRLAYLHNLGDVYVSLVPVAVGLLVTVSGQSLFDPLMALLVALWLIGTTVQEIRSSGEALLWPEDAVGYRQVGVPITTKVGMTHHPPTL